MPVKPGDEPSVIASTDPRRGLRAAEAAARLERDGHNVLPVSPPPPAWRLLLAQMVHFFAVLLWSAGALAFVAGMPQLWVAIFIVGWTSNWLLVGAVATELLALVGFLFLPPVASLLGHAPLPLWGWAVAALAIPALLAADTVHKLVGTREENGSPRSAVGRNGTR